MRWSMPTAPPICSSRARRSGRTCASISATASGSTSARSSRARSRELKGKTVVVDPERAVAAIFEALEKAGAKILPLRDPTILPKALKNPAEIAGQKAAQDPRRRGHRPLPPLDRRGGAQGRRRRADRVRQARSAAPREPGASRPLLRQHLGRRARTARSSTTSRARRPTASSRRARSI